MAKQYWLMKSEEDVYSIRDLEKDGITCWEGVQELRGPEPHAGPDEGRG